jgi:hypothetical protein
MMMRGSMEGCFELIATFGRAVARNADFDLQI